jgi:hypothetical protein
VGLPPRRRWSRRITILSFVDMAPIAPQWTVVYDASNWLFQTLNVAVLLMPAAIAFVVASLYRSGMGRSQPPSRLGSSLAFGVAGLVGLCALAVAWMSINLGLAVGDEQYLAVVGHVASLTPGDGAGRHPETLVVRTATGATLRYRYTAGTFNLGYSKTVGAGGPLHAGQCFSIADVGGTIARLAIADRCADSASIGTP